jgi:hypothetical protein
VLTVPMFLVMSRRREAALHPAGPDRQETLWKRVRRLSWWSYSWCGFWQRVWLDSSSWAGMVALNEILVACTIITSATVAVRWNC